MKITKLGHCCLIVNINGKKIMTDPGSFSTSQNEAKNINAILITHEHQDHFHVDSLKTVLENNPDAVVITNSAVGKLLDKESITYIKIEQKEKYDLSGITIAGFGNLHAEIYGTYGQVQNTGYMIDTLCYPGDAFEDPEMPVDILALPVAGPWLLLKDAINYAKKLKPRIGFPVHDAILNPQFSSFIPKMLENFLAESGTEMRFMELGKEEEF